MKKMPCTAKFMRVQISIENRLETSINPVSVSMQKRPGRPEELYCRGHKSIMRSRTQAEMGKAVGGRQKGMVGSVVLLACT